MEEDKKDVPVEVITPEAPVEPKVEAVVIKTPETSVEDPTDIPSEDIVKNTQDSTVAFEKKIKKTVNDLRSTGGSEKKLRKIKEEVAKEAADKFIEEKKDEIDYSTIEFTDDDKLEPLVTDEDLGVFKAATLGAFDEETVKIWVDIAQADIEEFRHAEITEDSDDDEKEYYQQLVETKDKARDLLAIVQKESRLIAKDFKDNLIAESSIKAITLNMLKDFTISSFKLSDTLNNIGSSYNENELKILDRSDEIKTNLAKDMFLVSIYSEYNRRLDIQNKQLSYNRFGGNYFDSQVAGFVNTIRVHANIIGTEHAEDILDADGVVCGQKMIGDEFDVGRVIGQNIETMNFVIPPIMYSYIKYDTSEVISSILKDGSKGYRNLESVINLNGFYDSVEKPVINSPFKKIYDSMETLIGYFKDENTIKNLKELSRQQLVNDKFFQKHCKDLDIDGGIDILVKMTTFLPDIKGKTIGEWANVYPMIMKFNRYNSFKDLADCIEQLKTEKCLEEDLYRSAFNTALRIVSDENRNLFCSLVNNLKHWLKSSSLNSGDANFIFGNMMKFFDFQFNIGYRMAFDPLLDATGEGLYNHAKKLVGEEAFKELVVDETDDILLKDVDLTVVRRKYYDLTHNIIDSVIENVKYWNEQKDQSKLQTMFVLNGNSAPLPVQKSKKKKSKKNRR